MSEPLDTRGSVESALARSIVKLDVNEHCDVSLFDGIAHFDDTLVGPPGRLHGGLHLAARTWSIVSAIDRGGKAPKVPMHIDVHLGKAIPLSKDVVFDGALVHHENSFTLETRFLESPRLKATARSLDAFVPPAWLDRDAITASLSMPAKTMRVFGMPFSITETRAFVELPSGCHTPDHELTRYLTREGAIGMPWVCAALDTCAAVGLGVLWDTHLFTTHAWLEIDALPVVHDQTMILIAMLDLRETVTDSGMASVHIGGRELATTRVPVLLAKREGFVPIAHGMFELHPVDPARFAAGTSSPREGAIT